jgi:hypothetical protein
LDFLEILVGVPRRSIEVGDQWCAFWEFIGYSLVYGVTYLSKDVRGARGLAIRSTARDGGLAIRSTFRDEGFAIRSTARDEGVDVENTCNCSQ